MFPIKDNIPTDRFPLVTVALILANVVVYVLSIRHGGSLISGPVDRRGLQVRRHPQGAHPLPDPA